MFKKNLNSCINIFSGGKVRKLFILLFVPFSAQAVFQSLYQGYKGSDRLKEIQVNKQIIQTDFDIGKNRFDWALEFSAAHSDSFLQSLISFQSQQTINQNYGFSLTKSSYHFGTLTLSHLQTDYDISNWASSSLYNFSGDKVYETKNSLGYRYEFLDKSLEIDWDILHKQNQADRKQYQLDIQKDSYDFFIAYKDAKLSILLDRLYRDNLKRAQERVDMVAQRFQDGLSRKLELEQAKFALLSQKELILKNKNELRQKVLIIENIIGMNFSQSDYDKVNWTFKPLKDYKFIYENDEFLEIANLELYNQLTELKLDKTYEQTSSSLALNLSYTKNSVEQEKSEAFSDSFSPGIHDEKKISLIYTIPLGSGQSTAQKKKLLLQRSKNLLSLTNRKSELEVQVKILNENLLRLEDGIGLTQEKIDVALSSVIEHKKLYARGQVSFEELLRSEESLINAKINKINMLALYETSLSTLAYLNGHIINFLNIYTD
jgi:outer membrane protein TolC